MRGSTLTNAVKELLEKKLIKPHYYLGNDDFTIYDGHDEYPMTVEQFLENPGLYVAGKLQAPEEPKRTTSKQHPWQKATNKIGPGKWWAQQSESRHFDAVLENVLKRLRNRQ